jgi:hypothetical protein
VAIAFDATGSTVGNNVATVTIDITAAATGAVCYCFFQIATNEPKGLTFAGWQRLVDSDEAVSSHFALWRRTKQSGDTTFPASWNTAQGVSAVWASYTGLASPYPDEGYVGVAHIANSASYTTPSGTPQDNTRWALACAGARSTVTTGETWTAPGALTLRGQAVNSTLRCSPVAIADSNGAVAFSAQSYTFTLSAAEAHGGTVLAFLIPAAAATPAYPPPVVERQAVARAANW